MAENIREVFWLLDWQEQKILYLSPAYEEVWGRPVTTAKTSPRPSIKKSAKYCTVPISRQKKFWAGSVINLRSLQTPYLRMKLLTGLSLKH